MLLQLQPNQILIPCLSAILLSHVLAMLPDKRSPAAIPYRQRNHNVVANTSASHKVVIPFPEESENVTRWIVDQQFKKDQERLKIPLGKM